MMSEFFLTNGAKCEYYALNFRVSKKLSWKLVTNSEWLYNQNPMVSTS